MRSFWKGSDKNEIERMCVKKNMCRIRELESSWLYEFISNLDNKCVCVETSLDILRHFPSFSILALLCRILDRMSVSNVSKKVRGLDRRQNFLSLSGRVHLKSAPWWQNDGEWHQMIVPFVVAGFSEKYTEERIFGARALLGRLSSVTHFWALRNSSKSERWLWWQRRTMRRINRWCQTRSFALGHDHCHWVP